MSSINILRKCKYAIKKKKVLITIKEKHKLDESDEGFDKFDEH